MSRSGGDERFAVSLQALLSRVLLQPLVEKLYGTLELIGPGETLCLGDQLGDGVRALLLPQSALGHVQQLGDIWVVRKLRVRLLQYLRCSFRSAFL